MVTRTEVRSTPSRRQHFFGPFSASMTRQAKNSKISLGQKFLLIGLGLFVLLGIELVLRLTQLGGAPPLTLPFIESPERIDEINPALAAPFFARLSPEGSETVGAHRRELIVTPKRKETVRVLFLGASSVEGFPLPRNLTAAMFLEQSLRHALPNQNVEVLNLGVTAVASFPVRVFGTQAIRQLEPDLVLVYLGHNELFGASGVASRQYLGGSSWAMRGLYALRTSGLGQLLHGALAPKPKNHNEQRENLIEIMAAVDLVEPGGKLHQAARRNLQTNLEVLVREAKRAKVPILLSTLVSLERGLHPIGSWSDLSTDTQNEFERDLADAREQIQEDPQSALEQIKKLRSLDPRNAGAAFVLGEAEDATGNKTLADAAFREARDLDAMPWRAPTNRSDDILDLGKRLGVPVADPRALFAAEAHGAPNWRFFYDHVHPSLHGQALLAHAFFEQIVTDSLLPVDPSTLDQLPDERSIASQLNGHPLEGFLALHKMKTLFSMPPMETHNPDLSEQINQVLDNQRRTWRPTDRAGAELWERMSVEAGFTLPISYPAARAALVRGDLSSARRYARAAIANAYPWSDQRCAARLTLVESWIEESEDFDGPRYAQELEAALGEVEQVMKTPGQPTPLLAAVGARLLTLANREAEQAWQRATELREGADPWAKAYLETLPSREVYEALSKYTAQRVAQ